MKKLEGYLRENIRGAVILRMKSRSDASDTDKPYSRTPVSGSERREAVEQACSEASGFEAGSQSRGKSGGGGQEAGRGSSGTDAVQAVQGRVVGDCGPHSKCNGYAFCLPILPEIASGSGAGSWI
jgi:hypothetical protein